MSKRPPELIDPLEFAEKGRVVEGVFPLAAFSRLRDQVIATSEEVRFYLRFAKEGIVLGARGRIEAELSLQCQACLGIVRYAVDGDMTVGFVTSIDQADLLPEPFEPVILDDPHVLRVADLIEDEILLSIPQVPRHDVCEEAERGREVKEAGGEAKRHPFAELAVLFSTNSKQHSDRS